MHVYGQQSCVWYAVELCGICPSVGVVGGSREGLMTWHTRRLDNFASHLRGKETDEESGDLFEVVARGGNHLMFVWLFFVSPSRDSTWCFCPRRRNARLQDYDHRIPIFLEFIVMFFGVVSSSEVEVKVECLRSLNENSRHEVRNFLKDKLLSSRNRSST